MEKILLALVSKTIQESTSGRAGFRGYEDVSITQSLVISTLCSFILASLSGNPWWQEAPSCNLPGSESVGKNAASLSNSGSSKSLISCHFITYIHQANPTILPVKLSHTRARDYSHLSEPGRQAEAGGFHPQENGHTSQKPAGLDVPTVFHFSPWIWPLLNPNTLVEPSNCLESLNHKPSEPEGPPNATSS